MFMQQMASNIFVRILRGMGACRKKPAQPANGTLSWMTPSETLLRLCLGGFGDMKWAWGGGWRLPAFLCQTTPSPGFCPISRAHFRDRKTLRKRVHHKGPSLLVLTVRRRAPDTCGQLWLSILKVRARTSFPPLSKKKECATV